MSTEAYRKVFLKHQRTFVSALAIFSHPNDQKRDALLSDENKASLHDAVTKAAKGEIVTLLLSGHSSSNKALILNQLAHLANAPVYRLDVAELRKKYIGETEKNVARIIAEAQSSKAILFFDEAEALFGLDDNTDHIIGSYANQEVSYVFKLCSQQAGLYVLASDEPRLGELLYKRVNYLIRANQI
ncbi:AAA family ATPase [Paraglaciecola sp.]|uniref:AAA family ATPase n=1 Tax=Paraglaciecola sp. TaxID=1920173 RepID=UPI00273FF7C9|nr:AAA family ATPase [Paraglaciecola sp.]MDP5030429.1 ATP-binding protein [Paraglaciecola sp.]